MVGFSSMLKRRYRVVEPLELSLQKLQPTIEVPPSLQRKQLPGHLRYNFLGPHETLHIIISSKLTLVQEEKLI